MAILKCKSCGGDLDILDNSGVYECEFCGLKQTVAKTQNEGLNGLYNRANMLRIKCEFDKAEALYEKILQNDSEQAEAYWGLILCKYGIEYVEDPKTFKRVPTCHRSSFESVTADEDYKSALQYADGLQKSVYEAEAKEIDRLQKDILSLTKNEEPYDVFICYKETDASGQRTQDSVIANDIYYQLTDVGFKVFYAAITLEDKLGSAYEPCIFAALNSAKVMLVIGTKAEYFNAVWVKNEWGRFLKMMKGDRSKTLIPCYRDMDPYDLPEEFAHLQAQDMSKIGFINDVVRGIKKLVVKETAPAPAPVVVAAAPAAAPVAAPVGNNAAALSGRGYLMLEDGEWGKADSFFEKALNQDAQCAEAYVGKFLVEKRRKSLTDWANAYLRETEQASTTSARVCEAETADFIKRMVQEYRIPNFMERDRIASVCQCNITYSTAETGRRDQLRAAEQLFAQNAHLSKAFRFAKGETADQLNNVKANLMATMKQRCAQAADNAASDKTRALRLFEEHCEQAKRKLDQNRDSIEAEREKIYRSACDRMDSTQNSGYLSSIYNDFTKLGDYKDSPAKREETQRMLDAAKAREAEEREEREEERRRQREAELKAEEARRAKERRKEKAKSRLKTIVVLAVLGAFIAFVVWPYIIYPLTPAKSLYTPEIVQSYSGSYSTGNVSGEAVVTFTDCDKSGNLTGTFEFMVEQDDAQVYGQYEITGKITSKKNNGKLKLTITAGEWLIQPEGFEPLGEMDVTISKKYTKFRCSEYSINWSTGTNEENAIKSVDDLKKLSGSGETFRLMEDIDLTGKSWTPIEGFTGTLMGNGHTIKGLTINSSADNVGFFGTLSGVVQNLKFEDASLTVTDRHENIGIVCGKMEGGVLINVETSGTVTAETGTNVGGIVGNVAVGGSYSMANLKNNANVTGLDKVGGVFGGVMNKTSQTGASAYSAFENTGVITAKNDYSGGVIGYLYFEASYSSTLKLSLSSFKGTGAVSGNNYVGGLFGYMETDDRESMLRDSSYNATVTGNAYVGCIAGQLKLVQLDSCSNEGSTLKATGHYSVDGEKYAYVGGMVGYGYVANNCTNTVSIDYTGTGSYVGGIFGFTEGTTVFQMSNLKNTANINGYSHVGGIFGGSASSVSSSATMTLSNLNNTGIIKGKNNYIGGIIGYWCQVASYSSSITLNASQLTNTGDVSGVSYVGGLFGYAEADTGASYIQDGSNVSTVTGQSYVGCIGGCMKYIVINDCVNKGSTLKATGQVTVDGVKYAYVGGFAGYGYMANNCTNEVAINYTGTGRYVAGIIGYVDASDLSKMSNLKNVASISGYSYVGGIFGGLEHAVSSSKTVEMSVFENTATIKAKNSYAGGIIAYLKVSASYSSTVTLYASDFKNTGSVSGSSYAGGLFGYAETDSDKSSITDSSTSSGKIAGKLVSIKQN